MTGLASNLHRLLGSMPLRHFNLKLVWVSFSNQIDRLRARAILQSCLSERIPPLPFVVTMASIPMRADTT